MSYRDDLEAAQSKIYALEEEVTMLKAEQTANAKLWQQHAENLEAERELPAEKPLGRQKWKRWSLITVIALGIVVFDAIGIAQIINCLPWLGLVAVCSFALGALLLIAYDEYDLEPRLVAQLFILLLVATPASPWLLLLAFTGAVGYGSYRLCKLAFGKEETAT